MSSQFLILFRFLQSQRDLSTLAQATQQTGCPGDVKNERRGSQRRFAAMPRHPCRGRLRPGRDMRPVVRVDSCSNVARFVNGGDGKSSRWATHFWLGVSCADLSCFTPISLLIRGVADPHFRGLTSRASSRASR